LTISEPTGSASFTIRLGSQPSANVVINLSRSDSTECRLASNQVVITPAQWQGVSVTVYAVDDLIIDGPQTCIVFTSTTISTDPNYDGLTVDNVTVTVEDDDVGSLVQDVTALSVSEPNGTNTFRLWTQAAPTSDIVIPLESTDPDNCTVPASVTITPANWATGVTVTV